jgi:hypothetical protein
MFTGIWILYIYIILLNFDVETVELRSDSPPRFKVTVGPLKSASNVD